MFLSNDPIPVVTASLIEEQRKTLDFVEGLKMIKCMLQTVHPILVLRQTCKLGKTLDITMASMLVNTDTPVKRADLLGEQLLTEVKPCLKRTALLAKLSMFGVFAALLP